MEQSTIRITEPGNPPTDFEVGKWIGKKAHQIWKDVTMLIEQLYPNVFTPEWLHGGKKHGWSLRYKKSKSFCTLIPEKNRFAVLIVFGAEERTKVEAIKDSLSQHTRSEYVKATTYHDGKWLLLAVDNKEIIEDIKILLAIKRKQKYKSDC